MAERCVGWMEHSSGTACLQTAADAGKHWWREPGGRLELLEICILILL